MKTILLLVLLNQQTGVKHTIEYPTPDFGKCLALKKQIGETTAVPQGYVVKTFECLVGAE